MGIIAIPFGISTVAPQAFAVNDLHQTILNIINAIKTAVDNNLDAKISTRASQTSVDNLKTTADAIKAKTDNLSTDPASNSHIDTALSSLSVSITQSQFQTLKCNAPIRPHVDLSGCNLSFENLSGASLFDANLSSASLRYANLSGASLNFVNFSGADLLYVNLNGANLEAANFQGADLTSITSTGCTGTPYGTPSAGSLPVC